MKLIFALLFATILAVGSAHASYHHGAHAIGLHGRHRWPSTRGY